LSVAIKLVATLDSREKEDVAVRELQLRADTYCAQHLKQKIDALLIEERLTLRRQAGSEEAPF